MERVLPLARLAQEPAAPSEWYAALLARPSFHDDAAQRRAVAHLERLHHALAARQRAFLPRWLEKRRAPRGVYLWGGVGRGKSLLMEHFCQHAPLAQKRRVHFHRFMQEVHAALGADAGTPDPLGAFARRLAADTRLLCLDEFQVSDIGDAMMLARLLEALLEEGVALVLTANQAPHALHADGPLRARFLPTIALLQERLDVVEVDGGQDYRRRSPAHAGAYLMPGGGESESRLEALFERLARGADAPALLCLNAREICARRRAPGVAWFDFGRLCGAPLAHADYLELAQAHDTLLLSGVPRMTPQQGDAARRFVWLVDVCYDEGVRLILAADAPADELYPGGPNSAEFARAVSRLHEMGAPDPGHRHPPQRALTLPVPFSGPGSP